MPDRRARADALLDAALDRWIAAGPSIDDLLEHRIDTLVAGRLRARGLPVPAELAEEERHAALIAATAPEVLRRVRAAVEGPVVLLKGLEAAACYPVPEARCGFGDLDVLVADAPAAQRRLIDAGFLPVGDPGDYRGIHHLQPLESPGLLLLVEVHHRPKWVRWAPGPPRGELMAAAVPGRSGVPGVLAPSPVHHAVLAAVHGWASSPLRRLRDLIDVHRIALDADPDEAAAVARRWGVARIWRTTREVTGWLLEPVGPAPLPLRTWARSMRSARDMTVAENHLGRWVGDLWARPPFAAMAGLATTAAGDLRPRAGETWGDKARRTVLVARNLRAQQIDHDEAAEDLAAGAGRL